MSSPTPAEVEAGRLRLNELCDTPRERPFHGQVQWRTVDGERRLFQFIEGGRPGWGSWLEVGGPSA